MIKIKFTQPSKFANQAKMWYNYTWDIVYVDDIMLTGNSVTEISLLKNLSHLQYILRINIA